MSEDFREINRQSWNARTPVHVASRFYDVPSFLAGRCTLPRIDIGDVGDVKGKSLLHLQCHFGLDTLSWARRGAQVTGIDFSDQAIAEAQRLKRQSGLLAEFIECDVYHTAQYVREPFDVVYTSWGALVWLPDLELWADMIEQVTASQGVVHVIEFHPLLYLLGKNGSIEYDYFNRQAYDETAAGTYTDGDEELGPLRSLTWNHNVSDLMQPLLNRGFGLEFVREYDYSPYACFEKMVEDRPGEWVLADFGRKLPYALSLKFARAS